MRKPSCAYRRSGAFFFFWGGGGGGGGGGGSNFCPPLLNNWLNISEIFWKGHIKTLISCIMMSARLRKQGTIFIQL